MIKKQNFILTVLLVISLVALFFIGCEKKKEVFEKNGNNGTVSCESFCQGTQWGPVGKCIKAVNTHLKKEISCTDTPGLLPDGKQLTCHCEK
jgi:hypothetical protein